MMLTTARDISNELSRHVQSPPGGGVDNQYVGDLVELLARAPGTTAEDAMAFLVWGTGFLKSAIPTMPDAEEGELNNPKYLVTWTLVLALRSLEALEVVTGIEAATIEGDIRRRN